MPRRRTRAGDEELNVRAEINITSLVDVAFTLLVIFIITAPVLQGGVEVNVPQADVRAITSARNEMIVTIQRDGTVNIADTPVPLQDFRESFPQLVRAATPEMVYIRGDSAALYGYALPVIATVAETAQEEGFSFGLVGEPIPPGPRR